MENKKLYRSESDQVVAGVAGGLGRYFEVDSTVVRIGMVVLILLSGVVPGLITYLIFAVIIPRKSGNIHQSISNKSAGSGARRIFGITFIILGFYLLAKNLFPYWHIPWGFIWPLIIVFLGFWILAWRNNGKSEPNKHLTSDLSKPHHITVEALDKNNDDNTGEEKPRASN